MVFSFLFILPKSEEGYSADLQKNKRVEKLSTRRKRKSNGADFL